MAHQTSTKLKLIPLLILAALVAFWVPTATAQNRTRFGGRFVAADFAYGVTQNVAPLTVNTGTAAGGTSVTLNFAYITLADGTVVYPLSTNAAFTIGIGTNAETVTPTGLSSCNYNSGYGSCTVTVSSFANAHGTGEPIASATYGLQEAINFAQGKGGGVVLVDYSFTALGGSTSTITGATPFSNVTLEDTRVGYKAWSMQPTTLTLLAKPSTLTSASISQPATCPVASCTWTASEPYFGVAYVDALGGITVPSTAYQLTSNLTASLPVTIASPAASTGAVGWIAFSGTAAATQYMLPVATAAGVANGACTLTTLETVIPACAIGSSASFNLIYSNTNMLVPDTAQTTANVNNPVFQAHTTFAYEPSGSLPVPFQSDYAPFSGNTASQSSTNVAVVATANLPPGYLNQIGRTIRVSGKVAGTVTSAGTLTVLIKLGWGGGYSTGAPTTLATVAGGATTTGTSILMPFSCTITTNAVGTTAVGSLTTNCTSTGIGSGAAIPGTDAGTATPVGSLGLFGYDQLFVYFEDNGQASTAAQLIDLHVETLQ